MILTEAWSKGSMIFVTRDIDGEEKRFVSKKNEPPSTFVTRILKNSRMISGRGVYPYLKDELDKEFGE